MNSLITDKKVIYVMTFTPLWMSVVEHLKINFRWMPVLYVGMKPFKNALKGTVFESVPFYDVDAARRSELPNSIAGLNKASLDERLLNTYAPWESVIYELMSRFMLGKDHGSYKERRSLYWEMLRIWKGVLDHFRPDIVVMGSMPHRIFDYLLFLMCKQNNITFLAPDNTSLAHLSYISSSVHDQGWMFRPMPRLQKDIESQLSSGIIQYLEKTRGDYATGRPVHMSLSGLFSYRRLEEEKKTLEKIKRKIPQFFKIIVGLTKMILLGKARNRLGTVLMFEKRKNHNQLPSVTPAYRIPFLQIRTVRRVSEAKRLYSRHMVAPDFGKPFIYFPANFQPERSTVPDALYYHDFHLILDILDKAVPQDWNIYYKEHPRIFHQPIAFDNPRDTRFFRRLRKVCPRIKFLDPSYDPFELIDNCKAVAMTQGTTGWEAIARGIPILSFATWWYDSAPGVFSIKSYQDCKNAIRIIQEGFHQDGTELETFLRSVESTCCDLSFYFIDNVEIRSQISKDNNWWNKSIDKGYKDSIVCLSNALADGYKRVLEQNNDNTKH